VRLRQQSTFACCWLCNRKGTRGPLQGRYGHKGNSSKQHMQLHKATGDPCLGSASAGTTFALAYKRQPLLLAMQRKGTRRGTRGGNLLLLGMLATYARCASASKVPLTAVGYLCFLLSNATYARCATASKVHLPAVGYATQRHKGTLARALRAQGHKCKHRQHGTLARALRAQGKKECRCGSYSPAAAHKECSICSSTRRGNSSCYFSFCL
jgi:hypothetical protein